MNSVNHTIRMGTSVLLGMILGSYVFISNAEGSDLNSLSRINGRIEVESNQNIGNISAINGRVTLHSGVKAQHIDTINGSINALGEAEALSLKTINGAITLDSNITIHGDVRTINGNINIAANSLVNGEVRTVNGDITLRGATIAHDLQTGNGSIFLAEHSTVYGDLIVEGHHSLFTQVLNFANKQKPAIHIGADTVVKGDIHLHQEVELFVHEAATIGKIYYHY